MFKAEKSQDTMTDEQMKKIDNKIRAYVTTMATELESAYRDIEFDKIFT